jgi:RNA recognition motif-containing protein
LILKLSELIYHFITTDRYGTVGDVYIPRQFGSTEPRGYAFVRFIDLRDAEDALSAMDGKELDGRVIRIQMARRKRPEDPKAYYSNNRLTRKRLLKPLR